MDKQEQILYNKPIGKKFRLSEDNFKGLLNKLKPFVELIPLIQHGKVISSIEANKLYITQPGLPLGKFLQEWILDELCQGTVINPYAPLLF